MLAAAGALGFGAARAQQVDAPSQAARIILNLTNAERGAHGLPPLLWDPSLARAAARHVVAIEQGGVLSHQLPGEPDLAARAAQAGAHFHAVAENIAYGPTPAALEGQWMHSPPHRANMLDPRMTSIGIAVVRGDRALWAVEDFAAVTPELPIDAIESNVETTLRSRGLAVSPVGSAEKQAARAACPQVEGGAGAHARFIMRWEGADLRALPQALTSRIDTAQYTRAAVGACPATGARRGSFSAYRVAVLLF